MICTFDVSISLGDMLLSFRFIVSKETGPGHTSFSRGAAVFGASIFWYLGSEYRIRTWKTDKINDDQEPF